MLIPGYYSVDPVFLTRCNRRFFTKPLELQLAVSLTNHLDDNIPISLDHFGLLQECGSTTTLQACTEMMNISRWLYKNYFSLASLKRTDKKTTKGGDTHNEKIEKLFLKFCYVEYTDTTIYRLCDPEVCLHQI